MTNDSDGQWLVMMYDCLDLDNPRSNNLSCTMGPMAWYKYQICVNMHIYTSMSMCVLTYMYIMYTCVRVYRNTGTDVHIDAQTYFHLGCKVTRLCHVYTRLKAFNFDWTWKGKRKKGKFQIWLNSQLSMWQWREQLRPWGNMGVASPCERCVLNRLLNVGMTLT